MPILILMLLPFLEVYFLFQAAMVFGLVNLIFFLLVKGMIGKMIMRQANVGTQTQDLMAGAMLGLSGLLISLPALLTNCLGLLLLLPPTRWLLKKLFKNLFSKLASQSQFKVFNFGTMGGAQNPFARSNQEMQFTQERDVSPMVIDVSPIAKSEKKD